MKILLSLLSTGQNVTGSVNFAGGYLGVDFAANLSWGMMKERLVKKAKAALACVSKASSEGVTLESGENLWRTLVRPILENT